MALDPLNNSNLEQLALKGLIVLFACFASLVLNGHFSSILDLHLDVLKT